MGNPSDTYMRDDMVVESIDGKEMLGRITDFNYAGGWVERLTGALIAHRPTAATCKLNPHVYARQRDLILATISPN
jgi:hypothetical protein